MRKLLFQNWWKYLGIVIMIYVLIAGFLIPLRPGILSVTPYENSLGASVNLNILGYNTKFDEPNKELKAYLKLDSVHVLQSTQVSIKDRKNLSAAFQLPDAFPDDQNVTSATLVITDSEDGYIVQPSAVLLRKADQTLSPNSAEWQDEIIPVENEWQLSFPFRGILYETIRNTFFHVAIWFAMFILLIISLVYSIKYLRFKSLDDDAMAAAFTHVAVVFGIMGMVTGSIWAKNTWGVYWTNDPKLNMSAVALMIYMAYSILRSSIDSDDRRAQISAAFNVFAFVAMIPLIFIIPRITSSLHPGNGGNPAMGGEDLDNTLRMIFYPAIIGFTILGIWISSLFYRMRSIELKMIDKELTN